MAKNENIRLQTEILQADEDAFLALKAIAGYSPANPAYSLGTVTAKYEAMRAAQEAELRAQNALDATRDATTAVQWEHHNLILGVIDQVIAQCGADSNELASRGLKKKSENANRPPEPESLPRRSRLAGRQAPPERWGKSPSNLPRPVHRAGSLPQAAGSRCFASPATRLPIGTAAAVTQLTEILVHRSMNHRVAVPVNLPGFVNVECILTQSFASNGIAISTWASQGNTCEFS